MKFRFCNRWNSVICIPCSCRFYLHLIFYVLSINTNMINFLTHWESVCISSVEMKEMTADWTNLCLADATSSHYVGILQMKWPRYDDPDVTFTMFMTQLCNTVLSCICSLSIDCNIRCFTFQMLENEMQRMLILNQFTGCLNRDRWLCLWMCQIWPILFKAMEVILWQKCHVLLRLFHPFL